MTARKYFLTNFNQYACEGDTLTAQHEGFTLTATIYRDEDATKPDERQDGFWPSLDPKDAGFIGEGKTQSDLRFAYAAAETVMNEWKADNWFYVGVAVTVSRADIQLTGKYGNALWGIECNYPRCSETMLALRNSYLGDVADELAEETLTKARAKLSELCKGDA
ncbi:MAG TPA: hypothetical protein VGN16_09720 [Acidobacteriaceae bacterium]